MGVPRCDLTEANSLSCELDEDALGDSRFSDAGKTLGLEAAKASGDWDDAYRLGDDHEVPDEVAAALRENAEA